MKRIFALACMAGVGFAACGGETTEEASAPVSNPETDVEMTGLSVPATGLTTTPIEVPEVVTNLSESIETTSDPVTAQVVSDETGTTTQPDPDKPKKKPFDRDNPRFADVDLNNAEELAEFMDIVYNKFGLEDGNEILAIIENREFGPNWDPLKPPPLP